MNFNDVETNIFFSTVRLQGDDSVGTGFIVRAGIASKAVYFVATARHVVENTESMTLLFVAGDGDRPTYGSKVDIAIDKFTTRWRTHPDTRLDLAVFPITDVLAGIAKRIYVRHISTDDFCTFDEHTDLAAIEDVTIIGYPNGIHDPANHTPIARRGTTATPPELDYGGIPAFLIDASIFGGSSGSPVYRIRPPHERSNADTTPRVELLGVTTAAKARPTQSLNGEPTETAEMIDLGIVHKAPPLRELINSAAANPT